MAIELSIFSLRPALPALHVYLLRNLVYTSMKPLVISRATVASSRCDPAQWSSNLQLAINSGSQITLLDPQLPLIHQSVYSIPDKETQNKSLDPKGLFNISTPIHPDILEEWPIHRLNLFLLDDGTEPFSLGGIGEPIITAHMWSPIRLETRDCLLGILLNTGELFILERATTTKESYHIKHCFFDVLSWQNGVVSDPSADDTKIPVLLYQALRVRSFAFGTCSSPNSSDSILGAILEDNTLAVHTLQDQLPRIALFEFPSHETITKHVWADTSKTSLLAVAAVLTSTNAIYLCHVNNGNAIAGAPERIKELNRFMVSKIEWHKSMLVVVTTGELLVYHVDFSSGQVTSASINTNYPVIAAGVVVGGDLQTTHMTIAYETGKVLSFRLSGGSLQSEDPPSQLSDFVIRSLYKFQLTNSRPAAIEANRNEDLEATKPYLNDTVEGNFYVYGLSTNANGIVSLVYRIAPKNVLNYTILSKYDFNIAFFSLDTLHEGSISDVPLMDTSLSKINSLWMKKYAELPTFPKLIGENKDLEVDEFVRQLVEFRGKYFVDILTARLGVTTRAGSFKDYLRLHVSENAGLQGFQLLFIFNTICSKSIELLVSKVPDHSELLALAERITTEQASIKKVIADHFMNSVLTYIQEESLVLDSDLDKYLAITFYHLSLSAQFGSDKHIPKDATVTIATEFVTESFSASSVTATEADEGELALSTTGHKWSRCCLTRLPLLELECKADELRYFNYIIRKDEWNDTTILGDLLQCIQHCIFTGNKIYRRD